MWPTQWMFAILGLLLVTSNNSESASRIKQAAQVCSNGLAGVERAGACCVAECGKCGGSVCGDQAAAAGLTADDCCIGRIKQAEVYCGDSGVAPCLIDDASTCSNGVFGIEAGGVCCVTQCTTCRDSGCGGRAKAAGLTEDDCCIGRIMDSDVFCSDSETAPCIIDIEPVSADDVTPSSFVANKCFVAIIPDTTFQLYNRPAILAYSLANGRGVHFIYRDSHDGVCGPALTITLEWSEPGIDIDLIVTEPNGPGVSFYNSMGNAGFLDMDASSGPGKETYAIYSGLDPTIVNVVGDYTFQASLIFGPRDTVWTLVATLIDNVVLSETGDFTESSITDPVTVSVTDYDPTCEDGTNAP